MKRKILIFGGAGLVGSSLTRLLKKEDADFEIISLTRKDADLFSLVETKDVISKFKPDYIVNAAAKVGGIVANNTQRTEFILESIIEFPEINLINLGSSCIYPLDAENPITEDSLMSGKLEPTNSPYAMAKLTAIEMGDALSQQYGHNVTNLMPTNLYGPNDNFSPVNSHVIPGLIYRMDQAKRNNQENFYVWGTGNPKREFLHVDDLSSAIFFIIQNNIVDSLINIGSSSEVSINELSNIIKRTIDYKGEIIFDKTKPDGNPQKLLDSSKIYNLGWKPKINLTEGIETTYDWFLKNTVAE